jgi:hypothetical protein
MGGKMTHYPYVPLPEGMIFVFGSNLSGFHGAGAAKYAHQYYGAEMGVGEGFTGKCYALPTKDKNIRTLPIQDVRYHIAKFFTEASVKQTLTFKFTPVGCGLAGFTVHEMSSIVRSLGAPSNVLFTNEWFV